MAITSTKITLTQTPYVSFFDIELLLLLSVEGSMETQ
jgi:hypothetical protein